MQGAPWNLSIQLAKGEMKRIGSAFVLSFKKMEVIHSYPNIQ